MNIFNLTIKAFVIGQTYRLISGRTTVAKVIWSIIKLLMFTGITIVALLAVVVWSSQI